MPSISRRASPSRLEDLAANLITGLAFESDREWTRLIRTFLKDNGWNVKLHGRPPVPKDELTDALRGKQIDKMKEKLAPGFKFKQEVRRRPGHAADDQEIERKLEGRGYSSREIRAIMKGRSLNAVACYCWFLNQNRKERVITLRAIQNGYAKYNRLKSALPL